MNCETPLEPSIQGFWTNQIKIKIKKLIEGVCTRWKELKALREHWALPLGINDETDINGKALQDGNSRSRGRYTGEKTSKVFDEFPRRNNGRTSMIIFRRDIAGSCQSNKYSARILFASRFAAISWERRSRNVPKWLSYIRIIIVRGLLYINEKTQGCLSKR